MSVSSVFEKIIPDIFPWTISYTYLEQSPAMPVRLKVSLTLPLISEGLEIQQWKELTILLPNELCNLSNNLRTFDVRILGHKIENGIFPSHLFNPDILPSFMLTILKTINELPVCPGIFDPDLVEATEKQTYKQGKYFIDRRGVKNKGKYFINV